MDAAYDIILVVHNLLRWLVILAGLWAVWSGITGWTGARQWTAADTRPGRWFATLLTIQLLVGLILYVSFGWVGRIAQAGASSELRFFAIEHLILMLVAVALGHAGSSMARRASDDRARFRRAAIWFGLALLVVLAGTPWPFLAYGRPWIRWPGSA